MNQPAPTDTIDAETMSAYSKAEHLRLSVEKVRQYYDSNAENYSSLIERHSYCYDRIKAVLRHLMPEPGRTLEIGCGLGQNLAALLPTEGVGIDLSPKMIEAARRRYPKSKYGHLDFRCMEASDCEQLDGTFDTILLANSITELPDVAQFLSAVRKLCTPNTRLVHITFNYRWEPILRLGGAINICQKHPSQNWLSRNDFESFAKLQDYRLIKEGFDGMLPVGDHPVLRDMADGFNSVASVVPWVREFAMLHYGIYRPLLQERQGTDPSVSVVVPCKDEQGNIASLFKRIPEMGAGTEIIFVDDRSTDSTAALIREHIENNPQRNVKFVSGPGQGKGAACRAGFAHATGDILMILDADMTTMPEALPEFFEAIRTDKGEFINGSRLVYPIEENAIKPLNIIGNKGFALLFSYLLSQKVKDTLCGTKAIWRRDYEKILESRYHFGETDVRGDYDWIFGANRHNLEITELPVHYVERKADATKMNKRMRNRTIMLRMCWRAFNRMTRVT